MERPFDLVHEGPESQLGKAPIQTEDTPLIKEWREKSNTYEGLIGLGKALSRSLRYREAIDVYSKALEGKEHSLEALRLRAGRYLSTLETKKAEEDFRLALEMGGDELDCRYRLGLALYYQERMEEALAEWEKVLPLADKEMEIALIYWHSLASLCIRKEPPLLSRSVLKEEAGHHYSYWEGVSFLKGEMTEEELRKKAAAEEADMEASMKLYALHIWNNAHEKEDNLLEAILSENEYWFCFTSLAAWNDYYKA